MRRFHGALAATLAESLGLPAASLLPHFGTPPDPSLGEVSFACFALARELRKSPPLIAQGLAGTRFSVPWIRGVSVAGPYLNFQLEPAAFAKEVLGEVLAAGLDYGSSKLGAGHKVVIDYSSPNIAKQLAVHHLRSTMIGNAIAHLHRALGYEVIGVNHLGDWGTSFGKLLAAWQHFGSTLDNPPLEAQEDPISTLNDLYVRFHEEAEANPNLEAEAREWFRKLETGDSVARSRWQRIRDVSWRSFERIYERLGVRFEAVLGESYFEDQMGAVVSELEQKGLLAESEDARVVFLDAYEMPPMLINKRDGATLYGTRDLAAADYRWRRWNFTKCLYVVDAGQGLHFRQLFQVLKLMGREYVDRLSHIDFGVMRLPVEGAWVRGKTRKGQVVLLEHVLNRARDLAREKILAKNPGLESIDEAAEKVGISAVVFADLKARRIKDVNFDLEQITNFEGETGAYLQYTHVRFCGIVRNYKEAAAHSAGGDRLGLREEVALLKHVTLFPETIEAAAAACEPAMLSQYLLELASLFNTYYAICRILDPDPAIAADRVALVNALRIVLSNGLRILGMQPLERM